MGYTMKGSPHKMGTIQGTSGHASALKQAKDERTAKEIKEAVERQELQERERINQGIISKNAAEREKLLQKENKNKAKEELKKHKGTEGAKKDGLYVVDETEGSAWSKLSQGAKDRALSKNKDKTKKKTKKEEEENKRLANRSEKTKNLEEKVKKTDAKTEETRANKTKAENKEGKYGKGVFGGYLRRKGAKRKHTKASKEEDKTREQLAESEVFDTLTPDEKIAKRREKMAYLEAMFNQDARTMASIAGIKTDKAKIDQNTEGDEKMNIKKPNSFVKNYNTDKKFDYKIDVDNIGADDGVKQKEGEV